MNEVITIGVDLAKSVFQVHGVDGSGKTVIRKRLRRRQVLPDPSTPLTCVKPKFSPNIGYLTSAVGLTSDSRLARCTT